MLRKYAESYRTLDVWTGSSVLTDPLARTAHRHKFSYTPRKGYIYVRSRAISSRCNDNYDEFPAEEIKKAYRTFVGKPVFVNHHNADHRRARGVIIDAALHEDRNPDGSPDTWVEVLMEVDAMRFPVLAREVLKGNIARTSMGTDVAYSVCTACGNKAATPADYCQHIPRMKGLKIRRTLASGAKEDVLIAERCYGLGFFENSLLVEDPADPTAFTLGDPEGTPETLAMFASLQTRAYPSFRDEERELDWAGHHPSRAKPNPNQVYDDAESKRRADDEESLNNYDTNNDLRGERAGFERRYRDTARGDAKATWPAVQQPRPAGQPVRASLAEIEAEADPWSLSRLAWDQDDETKHPRHSDGEFRPKSSPQDAPRAPGAPRAPKVLLPPTAPRRPAEAPSPAPAAPPAAPSDGPGSQAHPIPAKDVDEAARLVEQGKWVDFTQPRQVSTLVDKLGQMMAAAKKAGRTETINLCQVTVQGTNLFCVKNRGIPRIRMPQLGTTTDDVAPDSGAMKYAKPGTKYIDLGPAFKEMLRSRGVKITSQKISPEMMKASQNELNAGKVAALSHDLDTLSPTELAARGWNEPLFLSQDDYIVDGHHRWAGQVTNDYEHGRASERIPAEVVDMPILELLHEANQFAHSLGVGGSDVAKTSGRALIASACCGGDDIWGRVAAENSMMPDDAFRASYQMILAQMADATPEQRHALGQDLAAQAKNLPLYSTESRVLEGALSALTELEERQMTVASKATSLAQRLAYGETKAPSKVDTMRAEKCPVCGNDDGFSADRCQVCGYMEPPPQFRDPDLEKAQQVDLRQEQGQPGQPGQVPGQGGAAPATPGEVPGAVDEPQAEEAPQPGDLECTNCGEVFHAEGVDQAAADPEDDSGDEDPDDPDTDLDDLTDKSDADLGLADEDEDDEQEEGGGEDLDDNEADDETSDTDLTDESTDPAPDDGSGEARVTGDETNLDDLADVRPNQTCPICGLGTLVPVAAPNGASPEDPEPVAAAPAAKPFQ